MSYIRFIPILGVMLCLFACHRTPHHPTAMLRAEQLMDAIPDSALTLLTQLKESILDEDKSTQMYYYLLTIKAKDKCYIPHTSDSLIKVLVQYYEDYGAPEQQMEAYYYLGSTYRDMQDAPRALDFYQKAVDASKERKEYKMLGRIYSQMGTLYMYQRVYDDALPAYKKAYHCFLLAKDSLSLPYILRDIGRSFTAQHNADSTVYYYKAGYQAAQRINNIHRKNVIQSELASIYMQLGDYDQARMALTQSSTSLKGNENIAPYYMTWGDVCSNTGQPDSASFYYHKAMELGNVYVKERALLKLYRIERALCHDKQALQCVDQYLIYQDSIQKITHTEAVKKVERLYNYQHIEKENSQLALANKENKIVLYQLAIAVILLLLVFIGGIYYEYKRKQLRLEQERRMRYFEKIRQKESQKQIEQNNKQIDALKNQLSIVREQNDLVKVELLMLQKVSLEERNSNITASCLEQAALIALFHNSPIYLLIVANCKSSDFRMKEVHWKELQNEIDVTYNDFTNRLFALYPKLTERELRVCYLIKIGIATSNMAELIHLKSNSISSIRERLYEKIHGVHGTTKMMDAFIVDF